MLIQCLSLALLMGAPALQTKPQDKQPTSKTAPGERDSMDPARSQTTRYAALEDLAEAKVKLMADYDERAEAAREGERADRPSCSIDGFLIDHHDGRIVGAVVSVGGFLGIGDKEVAVPYDALRWNEADEVWMLSATEAQLEKMEKFDLDRAQKEGLDPSLFSSMKGAPIESSSPANKPAKPMTDDDAADHDHDSDGFMVGDKRFTRVPSRFCLASDLDGKDVHARDEKFGDISRVIVDRQTGKIEFVVVSKGGVAGMGADKFIVPFDALTYCRDGDGKGDNMAATSRERLDDAKNGERVLCIERPLADLEAGVPYEAPQDGVLDAETARRVNERFKKS